VGSSSGGAFARRFASTAFSVVALTVATTTVAASAATASCIMPIPGPPPQLRVSGYEPATIHDTNYAIPAGARFVANGGSDHNPGTIGAPFASIRKALAVVPTGGTIVVRGGTYRESLGTLPRRVTIQAYPHEAPWVTGSVPISGFANAFGLWVVPWTSPFCDSCYPSPALDPKHPAAGLPEQVFVDGGPLDQVTTASALKPHTFYVDHQSRVLALADNPTGHAVDVTQLGSALSISHSAAGSVIRGIGFEHWGTTFDGDAAVNVTSDHVTFDNDTFAWSSGRAIGMSGAHNTVTRSEIVDNGTSGINAYLTNGLDIEQNEVAFSNYEHWIITPSPYAVLAGIKSTNSTGTIARANVFHDNDSNALWFDQQSANQTVVTNTFVHNSGHGLAIEISGNSIVAGNVSAENGRDGLKLAGASNVDAYNNTIVDNGWAQIGVYQDPRHASSPIVLENNIFLAGSRTIKAVLNSYDITQPGPAPTFQMVTADDHNVYGRTHTKQPAPLAFAQTSAKVCNTYSDLTALRATTHRESVSLSADGWAATKILVDPAHGDYRVLPGAPLPAPTTLPPAVAAALGTSVHPPHVGA
jgi:hypothetical protein